MTIFGSAPTGPSGPSPRLDVKRGERPLDGRVVLVAGDDQSGVIARSLAHAGARVAAAGETLDILVFIASEGARRPIAQTSVADFSASLGCVLKDAFLALRSAVVAMRAKGDGGAVVFVAPPTGDHAFGALRQGLRLLTKAAALELGPEGIRVNIVLPGAMEGDATGPVPLGRACAPRDIADAVAFVVSDGAAFMTGADLVVDGGRMAL